MEKIYRSKRISLYKTGPRNKNMDFENNDRYAKINCAYRTEMVKC